MFKPGGAHIKGQILIIHAPFFGQALKKLPFPAALGAAVIIGMGALPDFRALFGPDGLRIGPAQDNVLPPLQLFPVAAVQHLVILPAIGYIHANAPLYSVHYFSIIPRFSVEFNRIFAKKGRLTRPGALYFPILGHNMVEGRAGFLGLSCPWLQRNFSDNTLL